MMNALYDAGHRNIALFLTDISQTHLSQPQQGFLRSMREHGCLNPRKRCFYGEDGEPKSAAQILPKILKDFPEVTAIGTENDNDALAMLIEGTRTVPGFRKNIQVTGFSGLRYICDALDIPSVDQKFKQMGEVAAEELMTMIRQGIPKQPLRRILETQPVNFNKIRKI